MRPVSTCLTVVNPDCDFDEKAAENWLKYAKILSPSVAKSFMSFETRFNLTWKLSFEQHLKSLAKFATYVQEFFRFDLHCLQLISGEEPYTLNRASAHLTRLANRSVERTDLLPVSRCLDVQVKKTSCINILRNRCNTFTCEMPNNLIQRVSPAGACHALGQWLVLGWLVKESRGQFNTIPTLG